MVRFDFVMEDADAENLLGFLNDTIVKDHEWIMKFIIKREKAVTPEEALDAQSFIDYYQNHITYVKDMVTKLCEGSSQVKEPCNCGYDTCDQCNDHLGWN